MYTNCSTIKYELCFDDNFLKGSIFNWLQWGVYCVFGLVQTQEY